MDRIGFISNILNDNSLFLLNKNKIKWNDLLEIEIILNPIDIIKIDTDQWLFTKINTWFKYYLNIIL